MESVFATNRFRLLNFRNGNKVKWAESVNMDESRRWSPFLLTSRPDKSTALMDITIAGILTVETSPPTPKNNLYYCSRSLSASRTIHNSISPIIRVKFPKPSDQWNEWMEAIQRTMIDRWVVVWEDVWLHTAPDETAYRLSPLIYYWSTQPFVLTPMDKLT